MLTNLKKKGLVLAESSRYSPLRGESRHVETDGHVMSYYVMSEESLLLCVSLPPRGQPRIPAWAWCHPQWAALPSNHTQNPIYWVLLDSGMLTIDTNHRDITLVRCRVS